MVIASDDDRDKGPEFAVSRGSFALGLSSVI